MPKIGWAVPALQLAAHAPRPACLARLAAFQHATQQPTRGTPVVNAVSAAC
jgi:hypothetical protein